MNNKFCCPKCFNDKELEKKIIPKLSKGRGDCSYCKAKDQIIIEPSKLSEYFEPLLNIYQTDSNGKLLFEWLNKDWLLFEHVKITDNDAQTLLSEILDDSEMVHQKFIPKEESQSELDITWNKLTKELMYSNRFFPDTEFDFSRLEKPFANLLFNQNDHDHSLIWFRARIKENEQCYTPDKMGAPPKQIISHGRANPPGIPYLYLGSDPKTAVTEVRPHPGQNVCVAKVKIANDLRLVDLCEPRSLISPFSFILVDEGHELTDLRSGDLDFLERLGKDLSIPINPNTAVVDYTKSQYLCEFIKKCDYQGVIY